MNNPHEENLRNEFLHKRVKHSEYSLRIYRDAYLGCGTEPRKSRLKKAHDEKVRERGTVVTILPADPKRGVCAALEIKWDDGHTSKCLSYMVLRGK